MATTAAGTPYVESSDLVANYPGVSLALANHIDASTGKVLQVVQGTNSTSVSTTSTSFVTTNLTATITPTRTNSRILVTVCTNLENTTAAGGSSLTLFRGTVAGTNLGNASSGFGYLIPASAGITALQTITFLDSPNTVSAQVYTLGMRSGSTNTTISSAGNATSVITLLEIGA